MPYGPDVDSGVHRWQMGFTHTPTGVQIKAQVVIPASEATTDAVFLALLDKVVTLTGVTVEYAKKWTEYESTITPTT